MPSSPVGSPFPLVKAPKPVAPVGFDGVAWCYDALAGLVFGPALRRAQRAALAGLPAGAPHVLILGGGTGWVLTEVLQRCPRATVLYLEASPKMLARAQARLLRTRPAAAAQVEFRHGTQDALLATETFGAIVTFFVLDCIAEPDMDAALRRLHQARRPGAPWLLADFRPAQRGWRWLLQRLMYAFFRLTTGLRAGELPHLRPRLGRLGLRRTGRWVFFGGAMEGAIFRTKESLPVAEELID